MLNNGMCIECQYQTYDLDNNPYCMCVDCYAVYLKSWATMDRHYLDGRLG